MIEYIKLFWEGAPEGEPVVILYEVDTGHDRSALRSIDVFPNRRTKNIEDFYADVLEITLYADVLEITPIPTVEELNAGVWGEEFRSCLIDKADFEKVWKARCYDDELSAPDYK